MELQTICTSESILVMYGLLGLLVDQSHLEDFLVLSGIPIIAHFSDALNPSF